MPRWLEIALTLVLFTLVMTAASWVVNATVPGAVNWAWDRIGGAASWAIFVVIIIAAGAYGLYDHRKAGAKAKGSGT